MTDRKNHSAKGILKSQACSDSRVDASLVLKPAGIVIQVSNT